MIEEICSMKWIYFGQEKWKHLVVDGKKTRYKISCFGNLKNKHGKLLSGYYDKDGYIKFTIAIQKKSKHFFAHRLVAMMFVPNPDPNKNDQVNHKDGLKDHNVPSNLEWCSCSENVTHAFRTGLKHSILGEENVLSVYSENTIRLVCELLSIGLSNKDISEFTNVNRKYITDIKKGRRWKHISEMYKIRQTSTTISL